MPSNIPKEIRRSEIEGFTTDNGVSVAVSDNGIGISKTDQRHIFDKFYRASTGNIHKFKGLGLGLYYVERIAKAHGGEVTVTSKPGKGSTFTVILPYYNILTDMKVLIAEDDRDFGNILAQYVTISGFDVTLGRNGNEAWEMFNREKPDICVLDVMMPDMDGFTLAEKIKEADR